MANNIVSRFRAIVREIIDGPYRAIRRFSSQVDTSLSRGRRDPGTVHYGFWDRARRGKAQGLEMSGLLLKPLNSKLSSWVMGQPPTFKLKNKQAEEKLNEWWSTHQAQILSVYEESLALGDYYLVMNADRSVTVVPPNVVSPLVDETNFGRITGWVIEEKYPHPTQPGRSMTIRDEYTATRRIRTARVNGATLRTEVFPNPTGRIPVIHVPNAKAGDETFGRPEGEALVTLLQKYGEVLEAATEGNIKQGRPTPTIEGFTDNQSLNTFWEHNAKRETHELSDGTTQVEEYIEFDSDKVMTLSGGGTFNYKSPQPFIGETERLLQLFYYLYLEHIELPEWVLGSAIASSHASAETQVEPLVKFVEKKRTVAEGWIRELALLALALIGVVEVGAQTLADDMEIRWADLTNKDGALTLSTITWALEQGLIDQETALRLMPVEVENPQETLAKARKEKEERQQEFQDMQDANIARAEERGNQRDNAPDAPEAIPASVTPPRIAARASA